MFAAIKRNFVTEFYLVQLHVGCRGRVGEMKEMVGSLFIYFKPQPQPRQRNHKPNHIMTKGDQYGRPIWTSLEEKAQKQLIKLLRQNTQPDSLQHRENKKYNFGLGPSIKFV